MRIKSNYYHKSKSNDLDNHRTHIRSLANATSFKYKNPILFLEFMINYQHDLLLLHFFNQKNLVVHLQQ
jgi:hypothetical protein